MYLSNRLFCGGLIALACLMAFAFGLAGCAVADETPNRISEVDELRIGDTGDGPWVDNEVIEEFPGEDCPLRYPPYTKAEQEFEKTASHGDMCPNGIKFTTWCGCRPALIGDDC